MTEEVTHPTNGAGEEMPVRCPECGEYVDAENYETNEGGKFEKIECAVCGETTFRRTFAGYDEDHPSPLVEAIAESEGNTPEGDYNPIFDPDAPDLEIRDHDNIFPDDQCNSYRCEREEDLRWTQQAGPFCPEHYEQAIEEGGQDPIEEEVDSFDE
jgi:ribosomal protein S27E